MCVRKGQAVSVWVQHKFTMRIQNHLLSLSEQQWRTRHKGCNSKILLCRPVNHPTMDEQKHQTWSLHRTEHYSASKRKGILTQATIWMNMGDTILSEINQTQKDKYWMILPTEVHRIGKPVETESGTVGARGWRTEIGSQCTMGQTVHLRRWQKLAQKCEHKDTEVKLKNG